jgi:hypothetical protein
MEDYELQIWINTAEIGGMPQAGKVIGLRPGVVIEFYQFT